MAFRSYRVAATFGATSVLVAVGVAGVLLVGGGVTTPSAKAAFTVGRSVRVSFLSHRTSTHISSRLRADFAVFRGSLQASSLSATTSPGQEALESLIAAGAGTPGFARAGITSTANATYLIIGSDVEAAVIPGTAGVCLAAVLPPAAESGPTLTAPPIASMSCDTTAWAAQHGLGVLKFAPDGSAEEILGFVPDGNSSVTVNNVDGVTASVPVESNVFFVHSSSPIGAVALRASNGASVTLSGQ